MKEGWLRVIVPVLFFCFEGTRFRLASLEMCRGTFPAASGDFHFNCN